MAQQTFDTDARTSGVLSTLPPAPSYEVPWSHDDPNREHYERSGKYGIMYAGDYEWSNERCTAEAFGDRHLPNGPNDAEKRRALSFCTEWMGVEEARECLVHVGKSHNGYQGFDATAVGDLLDSLSVDLRVVVARACKPSFYVWTDQPVIVMEAFMDLPGDPAHPLRFGNDPEQPSARPEEGVPCSPTYLGAVPNADVYPRICAGDTLTEIEDGVPTLVSAMWE